MSHESAMADAPDGDREAASAESSLELWQKAKSGDSRALDRLLRRYLPVLRRWATGRLPHWAREVLDTDDLVQETLIRTLNRMESLELRGKSAPRAYLRKALINRIRDELRRAHRRPPPVTVEGELRDDASSPLEDAIGREALERYEEALRRLRPEDREAVIARLELECSYEETAEALGKPSASAARMAVSRALLRLGREMARLERPPLWRRRGETS